MPKTTGWLFLFVAVGTLLVGSSPGLAPENVRFTFGPKPMSVLPNASSAVMVRVLPVPAVCVPYPVTTNLVADPAVMLNAALVAPVSPLLLAVNV